MGDIMIVRYEMRVQDEEIKRGRSRCKGRGMKTGIMIKYTVLKAILCQ